MENLTIDAKKFFYKRMVTVAFPVVIQNLISIGLNMADTLMIGKLGEIELAAAGAANQIFNIFTTVLFGLFSGAAVFVAQYWGAKDIASIRKIIGFDIVIGLMLSMVFFVGIQFGAPQIIGIFAKDPEVIEYGCDYIRIVVFSYIVTAVSFTLSFNSRSIQILKAPTIISAVALVINVVLNYILIYGAGPMPMLGIKGAAYATLIARICELIMLIGYIYFSKGHPLHAHLSEIFRNDPRLYRHMLKLALPVVVSEGGWSIGMALVFAVYGKIGASALAVVQVGTVTCQLFQSLFFGLGNGSAVIIGETLGMGDKKMAYEHTKRILVIACIFNVLMVIFVLSVIKPVAQVYDFNKETTEMLIPTMTVFAFTMVPRMFTYVIQCGILRAGGDTVFCMATEIFSNLFLELTLAYVSVMILHWPLHMCIALASIGNIFKTTVQYIRYRSKKWINIVI